MVENRFSPPTKKNPTFIRIDDDEGTDHLKQPMATAKNTTGL